MDILTRGASTLADRPARGHLKTGSGGVSQVGDLSQDGDGHLPRRLAANVQADRRVEAADRRGRETRCLQLGRAFRRAATRAQGADVEGGRRQGGGQGGAVQVGVVAGHGHRRPGVQADGGEGLGRIFASIGDSGDRRRIGRAARPDKKRLPAGLGAQRSHGQGGRVSAQHHEARARFVQSSEGARPIRRRVVKRAARAPRPIGEPQRRRARVGEGEQAVGRRVSRRDPLQQDLDARTAHQADVGPGTTLAIHQAHGAPILDHTRGVAGDVRLQAAAGEEAGYEPARDNHLGSERSRTAAAQGDDGGQGGGVAGRQRRVQGWPHIFGQTEQRPLRQRIGHGGIRIGAGAWRPNPSWDCFMTARPSPTNYWLQNFEVLAQTRRKKLSWGRWSAPKQPQAG